MAKTFEKIKLLFKIKELRSKILFVLAMLAVFRLAANIPVPGIDIEKLKAGNEQAFHCYAWPWSLYYCHHYSSAFNNDFSQIERNLP